MPIPLYIAFQSLFAKKRHYKVIAAVEDAYKNIVRTNNLTILEVNRFINRLIAIDRNSGKLVLIAYKKGIAFVNCVNLEEIRRCQVNEKIPRLMNPGALAHFYCTST
jgi:hypothetical protein